MLRLVRPVRRHAEILSLFLGELGQHNFDLFEVQAGDFFVELPDDVADFSLPSRSEPAR